MGGLYNVQEQECLGDIWSTAMCLEVQPKSEPEDNQSNSTEHDTNYQLYSTIAENHPHYGGKITQRIITKHSTEQIQEILKQPNKLSDQINQSLNAIYQQMDEQDHINYETLYRNTPPAHKPLISPQARKQYAQQPYRIIQTTHPKQATAITDELVKAATFGKLLLWKISDSKPYRDTWI